jgi:N-acetylmuramoyl-L-alanine amidase
MPIPEEVNAVAPTDPATCLALTAIGEESSQGYNGMQGVMNVICHRAQNPRWWGDTIREVCLDAGQFDCWNPGDDRDRILAMTPADRMYREALQLAHMAVAGLLPDITGHADSYYDTSIAPPSWADETKFTVQHGTTRFYRLELHAPATVPTPALTVAEAAPIPIPLPPAAEVSNA